jgi:hypothetical protein
MSAATFAFGGMADINRLLNNPCLKPTLDHFQCANLAIYDVLSEPREGQ